MVTEVREQGKRDRQRVAPLRPAGWRMEGQRVPDCSRWVGTGSSITEFRHCPLPYPFNTTSIKYRESIICPQIVICLKISMTMERFMGKEQLVFPSISVKDSNNIN